MFKFDEDTVASIASQVSSAMRAFTESIGGTYYDNPESTCTAVRAILSGQPSGARGEHERWCAEKTAAGWSYGPVRDNAAKVHPMLVDFDALPLWERTKDDIVRSVVLAQASVRGLEEVHPAMDEAVRDYIAGR